MTRYIKDPDSVLDYVISWANWLGEVSDTIATSEWIVDDGITVDDDSNTTTTATVWLSGGTVGKLYNVTNRITTAGGRIEDSTINIKVREK